jgi:hypothetical protein
MKRNEIQQALAARNYPLARLRPAGEFWAEFQQRAERSVSAVDARDVADTLAPQRRVPFRKTAWFAGPLVAAAAALVAALWIGAADLPAADTVHSYRVGDDVAHGGVMILNDAPSQATILWIVDCGECA